MKTKILDILKMTEQQYNSMILDLFVAWCAEHSYSNNHFQLLLINKSLVKWFLNEYEKGEKSFLHIAKPFIGNVPVADLRALYDDRTTQIQFYPKAILNQIAKTAKYNAHRQLHSQPTPIAYNLN